MKKMNVLFEFRILQDIFVMGIFHTCMYMYHILTGLFKSRHDVKITTYNSNFA